MSWQEINVSRERVTQWRVRKGRRSFTLLVVIVCLAALLTLISAGYVTHNGNGDSPVLPTVSEEVSTSAFQNGYGSIYDD